MIEPSSIEAQRAQMEESKRKYRELCAAYAKVFGLTDETRSDAQRTVYDDMQRRGYIFTPTMVPNKDGMVQDIKMECAEGMRIFMLETNNMIRAAKRPEKPKPTVKK
jgi:hypothetical protein